MEPLSPAELRTVDLLAPLGDDELGEWIAAAELREPEAGALLAEQGDPAAGLCLLLGGTIDLSVTDQSGYQSLEPQVAPTWIGAIPSITGGHSPVRLVAGERCRVAIVPPAAFTELAIAHRAVFAAVMRQIRPVMARIAARESNRERLAALGTMSAGLAHELNNPAAAARRAAADLGATLDVLDRTLHHFVEAGVERADAGELARLQKEALAAAAQAGPLGALDAADAEDDLADRLEELGVPEPWRLAEPLATAALPDAWYEALVAHAGVATVAALEWVAASLQARRLAEEVHGSAAQISSLVGAVKAYTYMDRGGLVEVDVHEGLETTLTVLGHKLKHTTIQVRRDYDRSLPRLTVHGSELNQVWTNLLDNAIAALGASGEITLRTRPDGPCVRVDVLDDGPGIPADLVDRVFEPFFTTKAVGEGTGLGLDAARRIVVERHGGSLTVESAPGRTAFSVWLPHDGPGGRPAERTR